jgi:hypothetical protein
MELKFTKPLHNKFQTLIFTKHKCTKTFSHLGVFFYKHFLKLILHIYHIVISHIIMNPSMEHRCDIVM